MSRNDPAAYADFIKENTSPAAAAVAAGTHIIPDPGFVVKTHVINEKVVVREVGEGTSVMKKAFVNITSHQAIEAPKAPNGELVTWDVATADGLAIPLAVGNPREWK